jgi:2-polyprenyl-6-methoxyphenol hydroxylase-like FAD-dependent oxidoreductase
MNVNIIGGGIGGLTTALALQEAGFSVKVFESVKEMRPLGVGINILPHCVRVLTNLGLQEKIAQSAIETSDLVYFNKFGQQFWTEPRGRFAGYKWPQFSVHRGVLQMILLNAVKDRIGEKCLFPNHHLSHFEQSEDHVTAHFIDKESGQKLFESTSDILIGADGINSVVRKQLNPEEGPPIYSENVLYRGTSKMKGFLNSTSMVMIGHLGQKMVAYPIANQPDEDGNYLINWVANVQEGKSKLTARDWNREADKQRLVDIYKTWNFDWLNIPEMIGNTEKVYEFPMSDRNPLDKWTAGRVTLLGDAAHPMYPIGSNGASQAILDADTLCEALKNEKTAELALSVYEAERLPATSSVVLQNRAKGPDQIMDMMEEWFPEGFSEKQIPQEALREVMNNYKKVAGFDINSLNLKT